MWLKNIYNKLIERKKEKEELNNLMGTHGSKRFLFDNDELATKRKRRKIKNTEYIQIGGKGVGRKYRIKDGKKIYEYK